MPTPTIHCHTSSDKRTVAYATQMWETMRSLANHPDDLKLTVHCIGPTAVERLKHLPNTRTYYVPNAEVDKGMSGSTAHSSCIEHALQLTDDGDIHLLVDSDTVMLARGWDDYVRLKLLDGKLGTMGATYEDVGGFSSGGGNVQTYKGIPNVVWMALSPLVSWRDLRAMHRKGDNVVISNEGLAKIYGLPVGHQVLRDVAWQIPSYLHDRNITYEGWKQLKPTGAAIVLKGLSDYHEEYHVEGNVPFVAHHRGSMRHSYRSDKISILFYTATDAWNEAELKREPRWRWEPSGANQGALEKMAVSAAESRERIAFTVDSYVRATPVTAPETSPASNDPDPVPPTAPAAPPPNIDGWLKATVDGVSGWGRYTKPVPKVVKLDVLSPEMPTRHVRLEGTVTGLVIEVPLPAEKPYSMTVRNMTAGPVVVRAEGGKRSVEIPQDFSWQLLADVDGVVHLD